MARKPRTRYQQIAAAVGFEGKLEAKLIRVFRKFNKLHFTFQHHSTGKKWTTTLSKLENYGHNKFTPNKKKHYWAHPEWSEAGSTSINFESFKVYIIRCVGTAGEEDFYKIGRTFQTIENRFTKDFPYTYKIEHTYTGTAEEMCDLEKFLHSFNTSHKYVPKLKFSGMFECFTEVHTHDGQVFSNGISLFGLPIKEIHASY